MLHVRGPGCCPLIPWVSQQDPQLLAAVPLKGLAAPRPPPSTLQVLTFSSTLIFVYVVYVSMYVVETHECVCMCLCKPIGLIWGILLVFPPYSLRQCPSVTPIFLSG